MRRLLFSGLLVSLGLFLGRLSGFAREAILASNYGASELSDLIILFFSAPDVLVNLLIGGALGMALIPEFKASGEVQARKLYQQSLTLIVFIFCCFAVIASLFAGSLLGLFAPGLVVTLPEEVIFLFGLTLLAVPLTAASGVTTSYLHFKERFFVPSLGTLIYNAILIVSLLVSTQVHSSVVLWVIAWGIILAALVRWGSQLLNSQIYPFSLGGLKENLISNALVKRYAYAVLTGGIIFMIPVIVRALASTEGAGMLSLVNYAVKLVEFPLAIALTVFSIIFFPKLAESYANNSEVEFKSTLSRVLLAVMMLSAAVFVPLITFSELVVGLVYDWGALESSELTGINSYFLILIFALPFQGVNALFVSALAARKDTLSPLLISSASVIAFLIYSYNYAGGLEEILYASVITYSCISLVLFLSLVIKHKLGLSVVSNILRDLLILLLLAVAYYWFFSSEYNTISSYLEFFILVPIAILIFVFVCVVFSRELKMVIKA